MKRFELSRTEKVIIVVAAVYVLSPFDIIPEIVAGPLGLTDDFAALGVVGLTLLRAHRRTKRSKALHAEEEQPEIAVTT